jgi:programmed cell death protein 5
VRLVKPDNARAIEEHVIRLARSGKLSDRIDEDTLKRMLEEVSGQAEAQGGGAKKVKIIRKKRAGEDDDDDDDEDF